MDGSSDPPREKIATCSFDGLTFGGITESVPLLKVLPKNPTWKQDGRRAGKKYQPTVQTVGPSPLGLDDGYVRGINRESDESGGNTSVSSFWSLNSFESIDNSTWSPPGSPPPEYLSPIEDSERLSQDEIWQLQQAMKKSLEEQTVRKMQALGVPATYDDLFEVSDYGD